MGTDMKTDVAFVESMEDPQHNIMHSIGTNLVTEWTTVCYTSVQFSESQSCNKVLECCLKMGLYKG